MRAIKCDRCEKYYEPYNPKEDLKHSNMIIFAEDSVDSHGYQSYVEWRQFELCRDCMRAAVDFMQGKL